MTAQRYMLLRDGAPYVVSAFALESGPGIRILAYRIPRDHDTDPHDCDGRFVSESWAYSGPREHSYRTHLGHRRSFYADPSKPADLVLDVDVPFPKQNNKPYRVPVTYRSGEFTAHYKSGPLVVQRIGGDWLRGFVSGVFATAA